MTRFASIVSTGRYIPEIEMSNDMLRERFAHLPDFVDKMEESSAIRTRWWAPDDWCASDIALPAARKALERAGRHPDQGRDPVAAAHRAGLDLRQFRLGLGQLVTKLGDHFRHVGPPRADDKLAAE